MDTLYVNVSTLIGLINLHFYFGCVITPSILRGLTQFLGD